jgi:hypothetical protein
MRKTLILLCAAGLCFGASASDVAFLDEYRKALRLSGADLAIGALSCKLPDGKIGFFAELSPYESDVEAAKGVAEHMIFRVSYYRKNEKSGETTRYFEDDAAVLRVDSNVRFHFTPIDKSKAIYFELVDPNMKPIDDKETPKNSRLEKYNTREEIYVTNAVRLWEDNAIDAAILCDMRSQIRRLDSK